jgi:thiol-disulfide isomerase/thioredoxin
MSGPGSRIYVLSWIAVALAIALAVLLFERGMKQVGAVNAPVTSGGAVVGKPLPDVQLRYADGTATSLHAFVGHPLWVNVFATWCVPCKAELPDIERDYEKYKTSGLVVLGIDQEESSDAVTPFVKRFALTYPVTIDTGPAAQLFNIHVIPMSIFIDGSGTVRSIHIGQMQPDAMDVAIRAIL